MNSQPLRNIIIHHCAFSGATEIDIVLSRALVQQGKWGEIYEEVKLAREACGEAHMKTILATGDCGSLENVYKAGMVSMMAGSDFIKTSTGNGLLLTLLYRWLRVEL